MRTMHSQPQDLRILVVLAAQFCFPSLSFTQVSPAPALRDLSHLPALDFTVPSPPSAAAPETSAPASSAEVETIPPETQAEFLLAELNQTTESAARKSILARMTVLDEKASWLGLSDTILVGKPLHEAELTATLPVHPTALRTLHAFPDVPVIADGQPQYIIRRPTDGVFELWTSSKGHLFNRAGSQIAEAHPRRTDGTGREWYGAFLPDGRWATIDLQDFDRTLSVHGRKGNLLREIRCPAIIGSARSTGDGKAWLYTLVRDNLVSARMLVNPAGEPRDAGVRWRQFLRPRSFGPQRGFCVASLPTDDGRDLLTYRGAPHGPNANFATFSFFAEHAEPLGGELFLDAQTTATWSHRIANANWRFGFWPASRSVFIPFGDGGGSWLIAPDGNAAGWIAATPLGDDANGRGLLFRFPGPTVISLSRDFRFVRARRFTAAGRPAKPVELFDDLHLGFFEIDGQLILASWNTARN